MKPRSLHDACYLGDLARARALLLAGADPNGRAKPEDDVHVWGTCAGERPRPLNCVAVAWALRAEHVDIARLLIAHGAVVDETVLQDHTVESAGSATDAELQRVLRGSCPVR